MSRDYKLNKTELLRLKREERLYTQYVPVLRLKMEALEIEKNRVQQRLEAVNEAHKQAFLALRPYIKFFSEHSVSAISNVIVVDEIKTETHRVAGVFFTSLSSLSFKAVKLSYFTTPPWLLRAIPLVKNYLYQEILREFISNASSAIRREQKKTVQKVNLFDMVLIPEARVAIGRIKIALLNEEIASISRGKRAKSISYAKLQKTLNP